MRMINFEKRIIDWFCHNKNIVFFIVVVLLSLVVRISGLPFIGYDMKRFLIPWFDEIKAGGGIHYLNHQVGNYNGLYQTVLSLLTYIDIRNVYLIKAFSILGDYILAYVMGYVAMRVLPCKCFSLKFDLVVVLTLFMPTVMINAAYWGQCDSWYSAFCILALYYLYTEKYLPAFIWLGVAFAFKLQAIFVIPVFLIYYVIKKSFSIFNFIIPIVVLWLSGIVTYIFGQDLLIEFKVYFFQSYLSEDLVSNSASFWRLIGTDYHLLKNYALAIAIIVLGTALLFVLHKIIELDSFEKEIMLATWCVWTCVIFMPAMHERYSYIVDLLFILLCMMSRKYIKYAVCEILISTITATNFLFENGTTTITYSVIHLIAWIMFSVFLFSGKDLNFGKET